MYSFKWYIYLLPVDVVMSSKIEPIAVPRLCSLASWWHDNVMKTFGSYFKATKFSHFNFSPTSFPKNFFSHFYVLSPHYPVWLLLEMFNLILKNGISLVCFLNMLVKWYHILIFLTKIVALTIETFGVNTFFVWWNKMNIENTNLSKHPGLFLLENNYIPLRRFKKYWNCNLTFFSIPFP